jgi:uncharacterized protein (DUF58 family)
VTAVTGGVGVGQAAGASQASGVAAAQALGGGLPPLLVAAERIASTVAQGVHGRRRVGQGDSFWQFRPLLPGEAAQRIDWRRSARAERGHFVRQTEWEAAQTVALWAADGPAMRWRSAAMLPEKADRALLLSLALAALLLRGGERVRWLDAARPVDVAGHRGLARLEPFVARLTGAERPLPDPRAVPRHACVVLFGDFLQPPESLRPVLAALGARRVAGHLLQVLDPAEVELPYAGRVRLRAPQPGGATVTIGRAEEVHGLYAERLARHQAQLASLCHAAGLGFSVHRTDHPASAALLSLYMALAPRRRAA